MATTASSSPHLEAPLLTVYEPHARGLPPMRAYLHETWRRRSFASRVAMADLRGRHYDTVLGQLWLIINPVLLAAVYYFLFTVLVDGQRGGTAYLSVLFCGLFAYYYTRNALASGAHSIVGGGNLVTNSAFPRAVLPLSAVIAALLTYIPMLAVLAGFQVLTGGPAGPQLLWLPLLLFIQTIFNLGLAMGLAAVTVYLRDATSFLPYLLRIWLYLSPVLYTINDVPAHVERFMVLNPLYPILGAWQEVITQGKSPAPWLVALGFAWGVVALVAGAVFFLRRERDFALRV